MNNLRSLLRTQLLRPLNISVGIQQNRSIKQYVHKYLTELKVKRRKYPSPKSHRNEFAEWNYPAELYAFSKRLGEDFDSDLLRKALTERSFVFKQEQEMKEHDMEPDAQLQDNKELAAQGEEIMKDFISLYLRLALPRLPEEGIQSITNHLTSDQTSSLVCDGIGTSELILCTDFPPEETILANVMRALVSALKESAGLERASLFIRDFFISQLAETDVNDFWIIEDPVGLVEKICQNENCPKPEARVVGETGTATVLPLYRIGIFVNKQMIGVGGGETVQEAHEIAAQDVLRRLFGTGEHQLNFPFQLIVDPNQPKIPNVSANEWCEKKVAERWATE